MSDGWCPSLALPGVKDPDNTLLGDILDLKELARGVPGAEEVLGDEPFDEAMLTGDPSERPLRFLARTLALLCLAADAHVPGDKRTMIHGISTTDLGLLIRHFILFGGALGPYTRAKAVEKGMTAWARIRGYVQLIDWPNGIPSIHCKVEYAVTSHRFARDLAVLIGCGDKTALAGEPQLRALM